jgi:hypothetical protein
VVVFRRRHHAANAIVNATEIETWTVLLAPGAMTMPFMTASAETGKMTERGSTAAALIEVRTTSSRMAMSVLLLRVVVVPKRKMTMLAEIHETQRYV